MGQRTPFRFPIRQASCNGGSGVSVTDVAPIPSSLGPIARGHDDEPSRDPDDDRRREDGQRHELTGCWPDDIQVDEFADWPIATGDGFGPRAAPDARAYYARESLDGGPMRPAAGGVSAPVVAGPVR